MIALVAAMGVAVLTAGPKPVEDLRLHVIGGLKLWAPPSAEVTQRAATEETSLVAVTDKNEALVLIRYASRAAPTPDRALKTHAAEVEGRTQGPGVRRLPAKAWLLGKERPAVQFHHRRGDAAWVTMVVAARNLGQTVVASWTLPQVEDGRAFSPTLCRGLALEPAP
jgi:hypothetical protein